MLKKTLIATTLGMSTLLAAQAHAGGYAGGGLNVVNYDDIDFGSTYLQTLNGIVGYSFNDYVSMEGRVGFGIASGDYDVYGSTLEVELDSMVGGYVRFTAPLNDAFRPYVVAGITQGKATYSYWGESVSESENDFSYGAGFELGEEIAFRLEYMRYLDMEFTTISGLTMAIIGRF